MPKKQAARKRDREDDVNITSQSKKKKDARKKVAENSRNGDSDESDNESGMEEDNSIDYRNFFLCDQPTKIYAKTKQTDDLVTMSQMIKKLQNTSSTNEKIEILKCYPQCMKILYYVHNPLWVFNISADVVMKNLSKKDVENKGSEFKLFDLLDRLRSGEFRGHAAIGSAIKFIRKYKKHTELICNIFDRNLGIRCNARVINKAFPGLLPVFSPSLAYDINKRPHPIDVDKEVWYASRKLDGVRLLVFVISKNDIRFFSRSGLQYDGLGEVKQAISKLPDIPDETVLDGELCYISNDGSENFKQIASDLQKKNHTLKDVKYCLFDMIAINEFFQCRSNTHFGQRLENLQKYIGSVVERSSDPQRHTLQILKQFRVDSVDFLDNMYATAIEKGWEGVILRGDAPYQGKRSFDMLKMKRFREAEFKVVDVEFGTMNIVKDGREKTIDVVSNIVIDYKGHSVSVGSGFNIEERLSYYDDPSSIKNKIVTIRYFSESKDKTGKISLRFPTFRCLHGEKRVM